MQSPTTIDQVIVGKKPRLRRAELADIKPGLVLRNDREGAQIRVNGRHDDGQFNFSIRGCFSFAPMFATADHLVSLGLYVLDGDCPE